MSGTSSRSWIALSAAAMLALGLALGLAFSLAASRDALTQQDTSSRYVRTCDGGRILLEHSEWRSLELHNQAREERGIDYLCVNADLTEAARKHSRDMMEDGYFSHTSRNGDSAIDRMEAAGYSGWSTWGENISWGSGSRSGPGSQFDALMNSQGHRENILGKSFREIGIGAASGTYRGTPDSVMYTMDFGARRGQSHQYPSEVSSGSPSTGKSVPGLYCSGVFYLKDNVSGGAADIKFRYGGTTSGTEPFMGDWDGDGKKTAGIRRGNTFYLKNSNEGGEADIKFRYGKASDTPVVGDWDGDGRDTVGVVRGNRWLLKNSSEGGKADIELRYGNSSDTPVAGDWNGDGRDTVGIVRDNRWLLRNSNEGGEADIESRYGKASDAPVVGDWDGDGEDTIGVVRGSRWLLRNSTAGGEAEIEFSYGKDDDTPIVW